MDSDAIWITGTCPWPEYKTSPASRSPVYSFGHYNCVHESNKSYRAQDRWQTMSEGLCQHSFIAWCLQERIHVSDFLHFHVTWSEHFFWLGDGCWQPGNLKWTNTLQMECPWLLLQMSVQGWMPQLIVFPQGLVHLTWK